jgi:hypothetical protein
MITSKVVKHPLIKIVGISLILYFALLSNKKNPDSLGNRLTAENIKKNLSQASNKVQFISTNLALARELEEKRNATENNIVRLSCGDVAKISYGIYNKAGRQLEFIEETNITIHKDTHHLLEKHAIGLEEGKTKVVALNIAPDTQEPENLIKYKNIPGIELRIKLLSLTKNPAKINCEI